MQVEVREARSEDVSFEMHLKEMTQEENERLLGDVVEFSEEALQAFREAAIEPIKNGTFSLERLEQRVQVVKSEISKVWNSALPDEEKYRQIAAKENEIALLQAGQYTFAKAGLAKTI
ncbi:hypothetical protein [Pseudodesulfovibrio piezophilus]|uniref:Uncharacterized protein n=1 Tax=Pseudodesulfovibrio piezophilus (strain DSM 21447 / JCM 15486 / C1TLV30) TaxID=1322246 RepID=M1WXZ7_PSEP2|nr:hypothetical protein [Pseudodesulfovibrio piezophilus]CCH50023.1 conserved protein of unknown function [Pseudodesulfovibrio piezophilus C1TLV30]